MQCNNGMLTHNFIPTPAPRKNGEWISIMIHFPLLFIQTNANELET